MATEAQVTGAAPRAESNSDGSASPCCPVAASMLLLDLPDQRGRWEWLEALAPRAPRAQPVRQDLLVRRADRLGLLDP
jgi:hypothetical protein